MARAETMLVSASSTSAASPRRTRSTRRRDVAVGMIVRGGRAGSVCRARAARAFAFSGVRVNALGGGRERPLEEQVELEHRTHRAHVAGRLVIPRLSPPMGEKVDRRRLPFHVHARVRLPEWVDVEKPLPGRAAGPPLEI